MSVEADAQITTLTAEQSIQTVRKIAKFVVLNNKILNADYIIAASRHKVGDPCDAQTLASIKEALVATGYFGFGTEEGVRVSSQENNPEGTCTIVIDVDENPKIERYEITGSGPISTEEIKKMITKTAVYSPFQLKLDLDTITESYRRKGFTISIGSEVGPKIEDPTVLSIPIVVDRVTEIKIVGNRKTKAKAILREMATKAGGYFNIESLRKDQQRIFNLGIFDEVEPVGTPVAIGKVALTLTVKERSSGQVAAGIGFSNRQQLVGFAQATENNFRGMAETVSLRWETGGITGRNTIELGYVQPWLDKRHTSLSVQAYDRVFVRFANNLANGSTFNGLGGSVLGNNIGTDKRYFEQRTGGQVTIGRPFRQNYRADFSLRAENVRSNPLALDSVNADILQNVRLFALSSALVHDTRDLFLDPNSGGYRSIGLQVGTARIRAIATSQLVGPGASIFGNTTFLKGLFEARQYVSLAGKRKRLDEPKSTLALRTSLGISGGRLPFSEQFFLGGPESLRGYREDRFWGNNSLLVSAELRQPLARSFTGVLFLDAGTTWGGDYRSVNINGFTQSNFRPRIGVGFGIRVRTPIAPIRIDFGFGEEGGRTHISFGNIF
jgi:outer membrane protein insertion porin family